MKFSKFFYVRPKPRPEETCTSEVLIQNVKSNHILPSPTENMA